MINLQTVRKNIICKKGNLYLDFTASGLAYRPIENKIQKILKTYANTHSEYGEHADKTNNLYKKARDELYTSLKVDKNKFYILPAGTGSTGSIKKFQEIAGLYIPPASRKRVQVKKNLPLVIVGPYEHHSNEISYREGLCEVIRIPLKNKKIDFNFMEEILEKNKNREIYGCFSAASNVTGIITPLQKISKLLKKYNAFVCIDAATYSPYGNIDCKYYDALFLSPHKLIGGVASCGLLVISKKFFINYQKPTFAGGGTVDYVSDSQQIYLENIEETENAGTPGILQLIRASEAYKLRDEIGLEIIKKKEEELVKYFFKKAKKVKNIILYEKQNKNRLAIFSFNIKNINHHKISQKLSTNFKIQTRSGCSCTGPYGHYLLKLSKEFNYLDDKKPG